MDIEFDKEELGKIVLDSYKLMLSIPSPKGKYEIKSRSKLKNLPEALREFEDPQSAVVHFVKSASYFLPRSDEDLNDFLSMLLTKVRKIQDEESDPEKIREKIRYLIGYSNWGMDAICNIFKKADRDDEVRNRLRNMVGAELTIVGEDKYVDKIVSEIMNWKAKADSRRY
ncbi:MAG: hypothetical protein U9N13_06355 [Euryarchaeota archaeon]|nr:hypothetical protein [Euryarchaeota archaeon]